MKPFTFIHSHLRSLVIAAATCAAMLGTGAKFHNIPDPNLGGGITVQVSPISDLEEAVVVEPTEYKAYLADIDVRGKKISIRGLPPGKYALLLKFKTVVAEGLHFNVPGGFEKLSPEDIKGIEHVIWISDDYFNNKTIARLAGNGRRVKILVDQVRDKRTVEPSGKLLKDIQIRRLEITEMRKTGEIWTIKKTRHLFREERPKSLPGRVLKFVYNSKLGKIRVGDEVVHLPPIDLAKLKNEKKPYFHSAHHRE